MAPFELFELIYWPDSRIFFLAEGAAVRSPLGLICFPTKHSSWSLVCVFKPAARHSRISHAVGWYVRSSRRKSFGVSAVVQTWQDFAQ